MEFTRTFSLAEFKELAKTTTLEVVKNPKTNKLFFTAGSLSGKVSTKGYDNPVISLCNADDEEFYMLHSKAAANVVDTL